MPRRFDIQFTVPMTLSMRDAIARVADGRDETACQFVREAIVDRLNQMGYPYRPGQHKEEPSHESNHSPAN